MQVRFGAMMTIGAFNKPGRLFIKDEIGEKVQQNLVAVAHEPLIAHTLNTVTDDAKMHWNRDGDRLTLRFEGPRLGQALNRFTFSSDLANFQDKRGKGFIREHILEALRPYMDIKPGRVTVDP